MIARATGAALVLLGAALAGLPALTWFTAPTEAAPTDTNGFAASGQLWLLPVLGALVVASGVGLLASRPGRARAVASWAGPLAFAAGLIALGFAVWAGLDPSVTLRVAVDGVTESVPAPVDLAPAAFAAPVVAGLAALVGAGAAWASRRQ